MVVTINPYCRVTLEVQGNVVNNTSTVRVTKLELRNPDGINVGNCWVLGEIRLGGMLAANMILNNTQSCALTFYSGWDGGGVGTWSGYSCRDVEVSHRSDGSMEADITVSFDLYTTSQRYLNSLRYTGSVSLPRIPRATALYAQGNCLGEPVRLQLTRAAADFRDSIFWKCGEAQGVVTEKTQETQLSWTPPISLAEQQTAGTAVSVTFTVQTFCGEEPVGTSATALNLEIPADIVPTLTVTVEDSLGYSGQYGGYIQGQSRALVKSQAQGSCGASIRDIAVQCGGLTGTGAQCGFTLERSGDVEIAVTATDSRGRSTRVVQYITVLPYEIPRVQITGAFRCGADGAAQPDGTWLCLQFGARVTPVSGGSAAYQAVCREHGGGQTRSVPLPDYAGLFEVAGTVVLPAGADSGYDCAISVTDSFVTVASPNAFVPVAFALLDFSRTEKAVGIGMRAIKKETLSVGLQLDMAEHGIRNLADPTEAQDAATKAYVDALVNAALESKSWKGESE